MEMQTDDDGSEPQAQVELEELIDATVTSEGIEVSPVDDVQAQVAAILAAGRATPPPVKAAVVPRKRKVAPAVSDPAPTIVVIEKPALVMAPAVVASKMRTITEMEAGAAALAKRRNQG